MELIKRERLEVQRKEQAEEKRLRKIADHVGAMAYFTDLIKVCEYVCVCARARGEGKCWGGSEMRRSCCVSEYTQGHGAFCPPSRTPTV